MPRRSPIDCKAPIVFVDEVAGAAGPLGGACAHVCVRSPEGPLAFEVTVPLHHSATDIGAALLETQIRLVGIFDDLVDALTTAPLAMQVPSRGSRSTTGSDAPPHRQQSRRARKSQTNERALISAR